MSRVASDERVRKVAAIVKLMARFLRAGRVSEKLNSRSVEVGCLRTRVRWVASAAVVSALIGAVPVSATGVAPSGNGVIAFVQRVGGQSQIYVMRPDGGSVARLSDGSASDRSPVWSPDGSLLAFVSDRLGRASLFVMAADGSAVTISIGKRIQQ